MSEPFLLKPELSEFRDYELFHEYDKTINNYEATIKMYASSTPKDIVPNEFNEELINWLTIQFDELFENYQETLIERFKLNLYQLF